MLRVLSLFVLSTVLLGCSPAKDSAPRESGREAPKDAPTSSEEPSGSAGDSTSGTASDRETNTSAAVVESPVAEINQREVPLPRDSEAGGFAGTDSMAAPPAPTQSRPKQPRPDRAASKTTKRGITTIRVFYGTDRKATGSVKPNNFYGAERAGLAVGFCDVSIPPNHQRGQLEAPSIWRFEFRENPDRHVVLSSVQPVKGSTFITQLRGAVEDSVREVMVQDKPQQIGGEAFVFVHGYNVTFTDAARRTAQMAFDLEFPGAPVMFSWPSLGEGNLASYREDERTAEWCEEHVMDFVTVIARQSGARRIHLIAHSMGNRVLTGVLRRLAYDHRAGTVPKFNEVILTAPDVDAETFKLAIAPRINPVADRITVYTSANDVALKASEWVHSTGSRLGQGGKKLTIFSGFPKIDVVDASSVDTSLFAVNHSYFGDSPTVLSDISNVLLGAKANRRGLKTLVPRAAWKIPERLKRISRQALGVRKQ